MAPTALERQLGSLRAEWTHDRKGWRESLVRDPREAASIGSEAARAEAAQALRSLAQNDPDLQEHEHLVAPGTESGAGGGAETKAHEAAALARQLTRNFDTEEAQYVLEWLVRRWRLHELDPGALLEAGMPYHSTDRFLALISILKLSKTPFGTLERAVQDRSCPTRSTLARACSSSRAATSFAASACLRACNQGGPGASFYACLLAEAVATSDHAAETPLLDVVRAGLKESAPRELRAAGVLMATQLSASRNMPSAVAGEMVDALLAAGMRGDKVSLQAAAHVCHSQGLHAVRLGHGSGGERLAEELALACGETSVAGRALAEAAIRGAGFDGLGDGGMEALVRRCGASPSAAVEMMDEGRDALARIHAIAPREVEETLEKLGRSHELEHLPGGTGATWRAVRSEEAEERVKAAQSSDGAALALVADPEEAVSLAAAERLCLAEWAESSGPPGPVARRLIQAAEEGRKHLCSRLARLVSGASVAEAAARAKKQKVAVKTITSFAKQERNDVTSPAPALANALGKDAYTVASCLQEPGLTVAGRNLLLHAAAECKGVSMALWRALATAGNSPPEAADGLIRKLAEALGSSATEDDKDVAREALQRIPEAKGVKSGLWQAVGGMPEGGSIALQALGDEGAACFFSLLGARDFFPHSLAAAFRAFASGRATPRAREAASDILEKLRNPLARQPPAHGEAALSEAMRSCCEGDPAIPRLAEWALRDGRSPLEDRCLVLRLCSRLPDAQRIARSVVTVAFDGNCDFLNLPVWAFRDALSGLHEREVRNLLVARRDQGAHLSITASESKPFLGALAVLGKMPSGWGDDVVQAHELLAVARWLPAPEANLALGNAMTSNDEVAKLLERGEDLEGSLRVLELAHIPSEDGNSSSDCRLIHALAAIVSNLVTTEAGDQHLLGLGIRRLEKAIRHLSKIVEEKEARSAAAKGVSALVSAASESGLRSVDALEALAACPAGVNESTNVGTAAAQVVNAAGATKRALRAARDAVSNLGGSEGAANAVAAADAHKKAPLAAALSRGESIDLEAFVGGLLMRDEGSEIAARACAPNRREESIGVVASLVRSRVRGAADFGLAFLATDEARGYAQEEEEGQDQELEATQNGRQAAMDLAGDAAEGALRGEGSTGGRYAELAAKSSEEVGPGPACQRALRLAKQEPQLAQRAARVVAGRVLRRSGVDSRAIESVAEFAASCHSGLSEDLAKLVARVAEGAQGDPEALEALAEKLLPFVADPERASDPGWCQALGKAVEACGELGLHCSPSIAECVVKALEVRADGSGECAEMVARALGAYLGPHAGNILQALGEAEEDNAIRELGRRLPLRMAILGAEAAWEKSGSDEEGRMQARLVAAVRESVCASGRGSAAKERRRAFNFFLGRMEGNGEQVEALLAETAAEYSLRLSEAQFRPMFAQAVEWAKAAGNREPALMALTGSLLDKLRAVFVPYVGLVIPVAASLLEGGEGNGKRGKKRRRAGGRGRVLAASMLTKAFRYDTVGCTTEERAKEVVPALGKAAWELGDEVAECFLEMAKASQDEGSRRLLHREALRLAKAEREEERRVGARCLESLASALAEEYLPFLPEAVPFLPELLEDPSEPVQTATRSLSRKLCSLSGEDLPSLLSSA